MIVQYKNGKICASRHFKEEETQMAKLKMYILHEFPVDAVTKHHKLGGLKQQRFILSQFWRPEVPGEGVGRVGSF